MAMSCASESFQYHLVTARGLERKTNVCSMDSFVDSWHQLRPGSKVWIDTREDSKLRTSDVTKFLASCSANGFLHGDLFLRDDLIESTSDCLAYVARTGRDTRTDTLTTEEQIETHQHYHRKRGCPRLCAV